MAERVYRNSLNEKPMLVDARTGEGPLALVEGNEGAWEEMSRLKSPMPRRIQ